MPSHIAIVLLLWIILPGATSDKEQLLQRLKSKDWPWFGDKYPLRCPQDNTNWPTCYNPRSNVQESVLQRVGIPDSVNVPLELKVTFSAPAENIDVCGKATHLDEVTPFMLNTNGYPIDILLQRGGEIYRRMPSIQCENLGPEIHHLLFIDVGLLKIRGFINNVAVSAENTVTGQVLWPYSPPANPANRRNPVLIVLVQQVGLLMSLVHTNEVYESGCMTKGLSKEVTSQCFNYLKEYFGQGIIRGLQIFYTDGSSKYEKYRACTESTFCSDTCLSDFKSYAVAKESSIEFMDIKADLLDMYVNINFFSPASYNYTACCTETQMPPYNYRATPGDNTVIENSGIVFYQKRVTYMAIELSGSGEMALDQTQLYSVLMVDPDAPAFVYPDAKKRPYGHYWIANLKYQDLENTPSKNIIMDYSGPTPPDSQPHTYFILLFSHTTAVTTMPANFYDSSVLNCPRNCKWNLSNLPSDFKLRAISWFKVTKDLYSVGFTGSCNSTGISHSGSCSDSFIIPILNSPSVLTIDMAVVGTADTFPDPTIRDYEYEDETPSPRKTPSPPNIPSPLNTPSPPKKPSSPKPPSPPENSSNLRTCTTLALILIGLFVAI